MKTYKSTIALAVLGIALVFTRPCTAAPPGTDQSTAIKRLQFLVGTWKSVAETDQEEAATEIRTIVAHPNGQSLTVTTETVLGKQRPVQVTFEPKSEKYVLTSKDADGEERRFQAELLADGKLQIALPQSTGLFSGMTFDVTVMNGQCTESVGLPSKPSEALYRRVFVRQDQTDERD